MLPSNSLTSSASVFPVNDDIYSISTIAFSCIDKIKASIAFSATDTTLLGFIVLL